MDTKMMKFFEHKIEGYDYLKNGLEYLFNVYINFDLIIVLLKEKIITGKTLIIDYPLITYIFELNDFVDTLDDKSSLEKMKLFIKLCLDSGGDINSIDSDNEIVYQMIFEYVSEDFFGEIVNNYNLDYGKNIYYNKHFIEYIKKNHSQEYKKYMRQQKAKKFNL